MRWEVGDTLTGIIGLGTSVICHLGHKLKVGFDDSSSS